MEPTVAALAR